MTPDEQTISEILSLSDDKAKIAMIQLYAKQKCIAFAEWMKVSAWSYSAGLIEKPVWRLTGYFLSLNSTSENKNYTTEELYSLFLSTQTSI